VSAEGAPLNLVVPQELCGAWERSPAIFRGPGTAFSAFPLTLTTEIQ